MSIQARVCQHLRASRIDPKTSARLASLTQKWVRENGAEWTAQRWKSLGTYAQQRLVNPKTPIPEGWKSRRNRSGKRILADGALHRYLEFGHQSPSSTTLMQMQAICRIATVIFNKRPTAKILTKALESISQPAMIEIPDSMSPTSFVDEIYRKIDFSLAMEAKLRFTPLRSTLPSDGRSPYYHFDSKSSRYEILTDKRSNPDVLDPTLCRIDPELYELLSSNPRFTSLVFTGSEDLYEIQPDHVAMRRIETGHKVLAIGRLSFLNKDGSGKIRVIANPVWELQCALSPLKQVLMYILYHDRTSAVHNQDRGRETIAQWLACGKTCYGFDQSAFTDRFPYKLQHDLLRELTNAVSYGNRRLVERVELDLMDFISRRPFIIPQLGYYEITYAVGQGMGSNPSFPLATLTHIMVCYNLRQSLGLRTPLHQMVQIVGDDIVISDDRLAQAYSHFMTEVCKVKINLSKSMISEKFTSFCGKIISAEGIIPSTKIRPIRSASSLAEKILHYGVKSIPLFQKELRDYPEVLYPYPYGYDIHPDTIPYKKWLESHDLSGSSAKVINEEIKLFVESYSRLSQSMVERQMEWDKRNLNTEGPAHHHTTDWESVGLFHRLPMSQQEHQRNRVFQERLVTPSFKESVDAATRADFTRSHNAKLIKSEEPNKGVNNGKIYGSFGQYTDENGYIDPNQRHQDRAVLTAPDLDRLETHRKDDDQSNDMITIDDDTKIAVIRNLTKENYDDRPDSVSTDGTSTAPGY